MGAPSWRTPVPSRATGHRRFRAVRVRSPGGPRRTCTVDEGMTEMSGTTETREDRAVLEIADGIAELRLTRGDGGNAIDTLWIEALTAAIDDLEAALAAPGGHETVRAVLITAEGRAFTVGGDIATFASAGEDLAEVLVSMVEPFNLALRRISELPVPVVAAVQGAIAGGGLGLAWASDIVLCAPEAKFATAFHALGVSGDGASSWYLPRLVGLRRAQEIMLGGRVLSAQEAVDWGAATAVVPADELRARATEAARELADGPSLALGRMRALLRGSADVSLGEHMALEVEHMRASGASADAREGVRAFTERRPAEFRAL